MFLFYINHLAENLSDETVIALFANNVSIMTTDRNEIEAERAAQTEVDEVP